MAPGAPASESRPFHQGPDQRCLPPGIAGRAWPAATVSDAIMGDRRYEAGEVVPGSAPVLMGSAIVMLPGLPI